MTTKKDRHADYYEAIIQLRPPTQEIVSFIRNQCKKRGEAITKILILDTGIDLYITSQKFARSLGPKLKRTFVGELTNSRKLYSKDRMSSKQIYRATILFRPKLKEQAL